jgi:hypothetical protein
VFFFKLEISKLKEGMCVTEVSNFGSNKDPEYIPEEDKRTANI